MRRMTRGMIPAICVLVVTACDGGTSPPSPVSPSVIAPLPPVASNPPPPRPSTPPPTGSAIVGSYAMTLMLGPSCSAVPEAQRVRRYSAHIDPVGSGRYVVTLSGSTFLSGLICAGGSGRFAGVGCNQFFASEDIDTMSVFLENNNDEAHGGHIVEQTAAGTWLEIIGSATGTVDPTRIELRGPASVWYCATPAGYPFPCRSFSGCKTEMQVTLTR